MDVRARIRERPLEAAGIVLGLGLLIGFLSGGGDKKSRRDAEALREAQRAADRSAIWEARARRLLTIARGQEEEIEHLEATLDATAQEFDDQWEDDDWEEEEWEEDEDGWEERPRRFRSVGASVGGLLSDLLTRGTGLTRDAADRVRDRVRALG
jgi:hypothetical protein